jgi:hypothetical protein
VCSAFISGLSGSSGAWWKIVGVLDEIWFGVVGRRMMIQGAPYDNGQEQ